MERTLILTGMRLLCAFLAVAASLSSQLVSAQDLTPRASLITPQGTNAVILSWSFFQGGIRIFSRFGGDYQNVSFGWQYAWVGKR